MKLNSLSLIIVLSLFAVIFSKTITYTIDNRSLDNVEFCMTPEDSFILEINDSNADFHYYEYYDILKVSKENENVYELITKNIGETVIMHFYHKLDKKTSFIGPFPYRPRLYLRIHVKEQC